MTRILIEGLDLAGKSTACAGLLGETPERFNFRRNSLSDCNPVYDFADTLRRQGSYDGDVLGPIYLSAVELDLQRPADDRPDLLQDSLVTLRSYAHYRARGHRELAKSFRALLSDSRHPTYDAAIVLTADICARRDRLTMRQRKNPEEVANDDLLVLHDPELFLSMERHLVAEARCRFGADVIDTTHMTPDEVVFSVRRSVQSQIRRAQAWATYVSMLPYVPF